MKKGYFPKLHFLVLWILHNVYMYIRTCVNFYLMLHCHVNCTKEVATLYRVTQAIAPKHGDLCSRVKSLCAAQFCVDSNWCFMCLPTVRHVRQRASMLLVYMWSVCRCLWLVLLHGPWSRECGAAVPGGHREALPAAVSSCAHHTILYIA